MGEDRVTWFCRFVRLSVGVFVSSVQFVLVKSEFCCKRKCIEGTVQERTRLVPEGVMVNSGAGVDWEVQMPPPLATATNLLPSADEATELQFVMGAPLAIHVVP